MMQGQFGPTTSLFALFQTAARAEARAEAEADRLRPELGAALQRIATLERENAALKQDQANYGRSLAVALSQPLRIPSPVQDFCRCVVGWNTTCELPAGEYFSELIPLSCFDHWELSGEFQYAGRPDMRHIFGLDCYTDLEGKPENRIKPDYINVVKDTEAVLATQCNVNDRILKVKSASRWELASWGRPPFVIDSVAFGPNNLPNFNLSPLIASVEMKDLMEMELTKEMKQAWPAGAALVADPTFVYGHAAPIPHEWKEIKMTDETHKLRPGTNSVKIYVCYDWCVNSELDPPVDKTGCVLRIRNLFWENRT
jgi:hypothetical protein